MGDSGPQGIAVRIVDIHGVDLGGAVLGTVALDAASLAALEQITVTLDAASLAAMGAVGDAAVDTDTTGTVSGKLRGLVKLVVNLLSRWPVALGASGGLKIDGSGTSLPVTSTIGTEKVYTAPVTGELAGNTAATQLPNIASPGGVVIKPEFDNVGSVYIGPSGVTKADGTTDTTTGIQLRPGEAMFFPVDNLNRLYRITDNAGDDITYIAYV